MKTATLRELIARPFWSKDVVVWIGSDGALREQLGSVKAIYLDLLDLTGDELPLDERERAQGLYDRIEKKLQALHETASDRCVLVVNSAALLARYGLGLQPFYESFGGSTRMTVLSLESDGLGVKVPQYAQGQVLLKAGATVEYLKSCLEDRNKVFRGEML